MLKTAHFQYSVPFTGNAEEALNVARTSVLSLGFEVLTDSPSELVAEGPGMHSNQQPDLLGATLLEFAIDDAKINVEAELGGVATMTRFVYLFPPGLVASLLGFGAIFGGGVSPAWLLVVVPWVFIARWIAGILERTTTNAIERLVRGMAQAGTR